MATPGGKPGRLRGFAAARLDPKAYLGLHVTVGFVVGTLGLWLFGALLDAVLDDATLVRWDVAVDAWVHAGATSAGLAAFDAITQVGSPVAMAVLALAGIVLLWRQRRRTLLVAWVAAFLGSVLLDEVLKRAVHRARPVYGASYLHGHSYSFPSGHAMGSLVGYGMLAYVLAHGAHRLRVPRAAVYTAAALLVLLVGLSRVYLGVHYPSDVVGGWAAGAAWLAICITGAGVARRRAEARGAAEVHAAV